MKKDKQINLIDTPFNENGKKITKVPKKEKSTSKKVNKEFINSKQEIPSDPYDIRNAHYSAILQEYKDEFHNKRQQNHRMRNALFWSMLSLLFIIVIACCLSLVFLIRNYTNSVVDIVSITTIGISFISTLIVIPLAITKSLFPEKENDQIVGVLTKLIENDINIRTQSNEETKNLKAIIDFLDKNKQNKKDD